MWLDATLLKFLCVQAAAGTHDSDGEFCVCVCLCHHLTDAAEVTSHEPSLCVAADVR